jgi:hypothetical protein
VPVEEMCEKIDALTLQVSRVVSKAQSERGSNTSSGISREDELRTHRLPSPLFRPSILPSHARYHRFATLHATSASYHLNPPPFRLPPAPSVAPTRTR